MPELPEVETTRRGIAPAMEGRRITAVRVRQRQLRKPVPRRLERDLPGQCLRRVWRRGKYLLLEADQGTVIIHLGMSGSLRLVDAATPPGAHDHVDLCFSGGRCLRLRDPRRFGLVLWTTADPLRHPLLAELGPEPLTEDFDGDYLFRRSRHRRQAVKLFIMDGRVVAGVGNIYANEALFRAGIHPARAAGRISRPRHHALAAAIKATLRAAIKAGGTTLQDFVSESGEPGYFRQQLTVYGRAGLPCPRCGATIRTLRLGQRATYYCPRCQR
ncbi:MAG TPA: bifunctional DNA-formamidopyrimidine glycosylase/DNA-(apurinic or apyrimidinic site) lyase [Gammaproteobacteria bacterium]|nr:bifunctional DNA-formamidopyrimidine glycosylase/DNA-(apurinic or apyrimidinic site) lyase [Gammaproteobacteria bacterium]